MLISKASLEKMYANDEHEEEDAVRGIDIPQIINSRSSAQVLSTNEQIKKIMASMDLENIEAKLLAQQKK